MSVSNIFSFFLSSKVYAFRFEADNLLPLQTEFENYRSIYMGLGYLLVFFANIVTCLRSCENRVSENFAGFSRIFSMCSFTIYSYEAGDLLPYQAEFFFILSLYMLECWSRAAPECWATCFSGLGWSFFSNMCMLFVLEKR